MTKPQTNTDSRRRPIRTRDTRWAAATAKALGAAGVRPNQISVASVVMACGAGGCLLATRMQGGAVADTLWYVAAAAFVQLRLLCNLFDGMVAVEGGLATPAGEIYNDLPDRLADPIILICAGYAAAGAVAWAAPLGWLAGLLAVMTAYVRLLGAASGAKQNFLGPMAKPQRMAVITIAAVAAAGELWLGSPGWSLPAALAIISVGCVVTLIRRTAAIARQLNES